MGAIMALAFAMATPVQAAPLVLNEAAMPVVTVPDLPRPPRKPAADRKAAAPDSKPLSLRAAEPHAPAAAVTKREAPVAPKQDFGRIKLDTGTFGLETETKFNAYKFPDGRPLSGLSATQTKEPSFFGFSLSVPTR